MSDEVIDDDLEDPCEKLKEQCTEGDQGSIAAFEKLQQCNDRVNSRGVTAETCHEEVVDYVEAVNKCIGHKLFDHLK